MPVQRVLALMTVLGTLVLLHTAIRAEPPRAAGASRTVVSLSPAATDMLQALNAEAVIGVSTYDAGDLPKVGDYLQPEWEKIIALAPEVMVIQMAADKVPPGLKTRAADLGIELVNVKIDRLADVRAAWTQLADAIHATPDERKIIGQTFERIDALRNRRGEVSAKVLMVTDADLTFAVGRDNFLNDLLIAAGGENALPAGSAAYPRLDPERILSLKPRTVIQLMPGADEKSRAAADAAWAKLGLSARRVLITDDRILIPGSHVADTAEAIAKALAD